MNIRDDEIVPMNDQPWPLDEVVLKLCEAADILLHDKDYDGHGWELIQEAEKVGREWVTTVRERVSRTFRLNKESGVAP